MWFAADGWVDEGNATFVSRISAGKFFYDNALQIYVHTLRVDGAFVRFVRRS